ncbi:MAG: ankyrin repeat domain-containing protein [Gemmatimonadaceae bacterium]
MHECFSMAVVCGDLGAVSRVLGQRPGAADEKSSTASPDRARAGHPGDLSRDLGPKGWEPLLYLCFTRLPLPAANDNVVAIARALLDSGANPNAYFMAGDSRYTPLVGAVGEGEEARPPHPRRDELVRLLLERGAEPYDIQVIYNIAFRGDVLWFLELIHAQAMKLGRQSDWEDPNWSMLDMGGYGSGARWHLDIAIKNNDLRLAEWLLEHGANPNAAPARDTRFSQRTPYEEAVRKGHTEMAELLLRHGATASVVVLEGIEAFVAACLRLDRDAVRTMLVRNPEFLRSPEAMFAAAKRDRADVVVSLLELGMSPDVENQHGERPLHIAAYAGSIRVAELLIASGAEIDPVESHWSNTPLGAAVYAQQTPTIELLGRYSRDVFELTYAGNVERLREVLGADPSKAKIVADGQTPLMWLPPADEARAIEIVELFLAHGADASIQNPRGQTASDRAERLALFDAAKLLRSKGPSVG